MVQDEHQDRPRASDSYVEKLKILCRFAVRRGYRPDNPAAPVELLGGAGGTYEPWPDLALERFAAEASLMHRRAFALLLYTGQRSGDVRTMPWTKYRGGGIEMVQSKTGEPLWIPVHRNLRALLDDAERQHVMMLHTDHCNSFGATYFGAWFRREMARLGLGGLQPHGLRKNAVCALLEAGCSEAETAAITGQSLRMVMHYAQKVNQKRLATSAMAKWEREHMTHRKWQTSPRKVANRSKKTWYPLGELNSCFQVENLTS
jgi:integrase